MATSTLLTTHLSRSPPPSARHQNFPFPSLAPLSPSTSNSKVGRDRVRTAYKSDRSAPHPPYARSRSRAQDQQPKEEEKIQQVFFPPFESLSSKTTTTPDPSTSTAVRPSSRAEGSQATDVDPELDSSTQAWAALLSSSITSAAGKSSTLGIGEVEDHRYLGGRSSSGTRGEEFVHQQSQGYSHSRGNSLSGRNRQRGNDRDGIGSNDKAVYRDRQTRGVRVTSPSPFPIPLGKRILDTMEIGVRTTIEPKLKMIKGHIRSRSTVEGGSGGIYNAIGLSIDSSSVESMLSSGILLPQPEAIESFITYNANTPRTPQYIPIPSSSTSSRAQSVPPSSSQPEPISPLTRRARKVLGEMDLDMMNTPLEECRGGEGKVEAIRLDDIRSKGVQGGMRGVEASLGRTGLVRPPTPKLQRSNTLPARPKRKALSADLTHPTNRRCLVITPAETPTEACTPRKPRARPPPLRDLPPPSWSCPGPSPPLTSLAPPFSTDLFVLPYPNPIATVMYSLNDTPPISPQNREVVVRSAPAEVVSDPIEELYEPKFKRTRRRGSSLSSFESTTETIRPWHLLSDITPKASRAQLREQIEDGQGGTAAAAMHTELQLESLVCDWDFDAEDERGRLGKKVRKPSQMDRERMREEIRTLRRKSEGKRAKYANRA